MDKKFIIKGMDRYLFSQEDMIRKAVLKHWPEKNVVLLNEYVNNGKVFSAFSPELKYFKWKILTPSGAKYKVHDKGNTNIDRISIPAYQLNHVCKQMLAKELKFVVLDTDEETGINFGRRKVIRSDDQNDLSSSHRF
ncbi:MAG: hypothetical protein CMC28_00425 [Flavobacteriaceae bacterium]|nr:hypothetical protein [Flavobacteriaceae bacterium]